jgi:hypothetical protein
MYDIIFSEALLMNCWHKLVPTLLKPVRTLSRNCKEFEVLDKVLVSISPS